MPGAQRGSTRLVGVQLGSRRISQVRLGSRLLWTAEPPIFDYFDRANSGDIDPSGTVWALVSRSGNDVDAGVSNGTCRVTMSSPGPGVRFVYRRYVAETALSDDGHVEVRAVSVGERNLPTQVFRRGNNAGNFTHGVGIHMQSGHLWIVRRVNNVDALVADCGSFVAGDVLRLKQKNNLHLLYRNGDLVGQWNDADATAAKGTGYRSVVLRVSGEYPSGKYYYASPALDYVEAT